MKTLVLVALLAAAAPAFADEEGHCVEIMCDTRSKHPMESFPCGTPDCACWDSCDGSSAPATNQSGEAMVRALGMLIGYTVGGIAFVFLPGHMAEFTAKDGPKQTAEQAHEDWNKFVAKRKELVDAGHEAKKSRDAMWALDAEERAQLRDAPRNKPAKVPVPFNPPKLRPDPHYQCDQAKMLWPSVHTGGPIGPFPDEDAMDATCRQFYEMPVTADESCAADKSFRCGMSPKEQCCPRTHPILNPCDGRCYRDTDFRGGPEPLRHCGDARDCATFDPNKP